MHAVNTWNSFQFQCQLPLQPTERNRQKTIIRLEMKAQRKNTKSTLKWMKMDENGKKCIQKKTKPKKKKKRSNDNAKIKSIYWTKKPYISIRKANLWYEFLRTHVDATITKFSISALKPLFLIFFWLLFLTRRLCGAPSLPGTQIEAYTSTTAYYVNRFFFVYSSARIGIIPCGIKTNAIFLIYSLCCMQRHNTVYM